MSKTNSQSVQADGSNVSKLSAEVPSNCYSQKKHEAFWDNIPSHKDGSRPYLDSCIGKAVNAEFDRLTEQQHEDAAKITVLETKLNTIKDDATELFVEFRTLEDTFDLPQTHAHHLIKEIIRETSLKRRR
jgi:hypothetical protein|tara:strand:- start:401 stop:790 length:390 start_codon:yes stop_codon:yes gene_type:complete